MRKLIAFVLVGLLLVGVAGCSSGVSQEEYDKVVAERDALLNQIEGMGEVPASPSEMITNKADVEDNSGRI